MSHTPLASLNTSDLAEILFCCGLQESDHPSAEQVRAAIEDRLDGRPERLTACAATVAQEAGDHPETYLARMRWALTTVSAAYRGRVAMA